MKNLMTFMAFVITTLLGLCVWWLSGFNFDQRNPDVAFGAVMVLVVSGAVAFIVRTKPEGL